MNTPQIIDKKWKREERCSKLIVESLNLSKGKTIKTDRADTTVKTGD